MRIELDKGKRWFWRVVAANGQTLLTSETYYSKFNARRAAKRFASVNKLTYKEIR